MPKVELHVHLEGSILPETLLLLAKKNNVTLPAKSIEEIRKWYRFSSFDHFVEVYFAICSCLRAPEDFELIVFEFLKNQARQNIKYSEVIFTPFTHVKRVSFDEQLAAINKAREKAEKEYGVTMGLVPDLARNMRPVEESLKVVDWAIKNMGNGIIGFGLGGPETGNPPELFAETFARAKNANLPALPHAGETEGADSVWGAIKTLSAKRIGHGVRCLEDPGLVKFLRENQIPLDVSVTSNVCLGVADSIENHPLPELLSEGLFVTINSDDPPMFNTTLTEEYLKIAKTFDFGKETIKQLALNGVKASLLPGEEKLKLTSLFEKEFAELGKELLGRN